MARAKNKIELLIEAKVKDAIRELDKTEEGLNRLAKQGSKTGVIFGKMKTALGGFIGAIALKQVAGYAVELAELGDAAQQVEKPFKKLVTLAGKDAPGALAILRKAVRGTATDVELMQRAAAAMDAFTSSGLSAGEAFEATQKTMDFLYRYATKFGKNFNELMQTVFTGLQRGSALFLDDVGIMIDQTSEQFKGLDAVEKKAAIVRESLEQMARKNELLGEVTEQSNVKIKQASVEYENLKAELGKLLNEPVGEFFSFLSGTLKSITSELNLASKRTEKQRMELNALVGAITDANTSEKIRKDLLVKLNEEYPDFLKNLNAETVSNETLTKRLKETNAQLLNKILLQRADERREATAQKQADAYEAQKKAIVSLSGKIEEYQKKFGITVDKNKTLIEQAEELRYKIGNIQVGSGLASARGVLLSGIDDVKVATDDYTKATEELSVKTSELVKLQNELGISLDKISEKEKKGKPTTPNIPAASISDEDKKRKEALELQLKLNRIELDDTKDKYQKMREAVKARYDAEIKAAKGKTDIIKALRRLEADEVTKIDKQEKEERIQREQEQAQKIREIRENLSLMGEEDIYKKRIMETENYYDREIELAKGNTELITLLEQEKTAKLKEIYDEWLQYKADTYLQDHELQAAFVNAAEAGYDSFINHLLDTEMTGAEKRKAIWMDMKRAFVASVADALKEYMSKKAAELLVYLTTEQGKTAAKKTGTIQRVTYDHTEQISSETNTAENTKEAASKFFAAYAKIPWVGYAIAIAAIGGMLAMLASIGKKSKGGIVTAGDLFTGMAPENEDGLIAIQKDEFVVNKEATRKNRALLEAINQNKPLPPAAQGKGMTPRPGRLSLPPGYSLSELPAPQPAPIQREFYSVERVVEKAIPVSGEFTVRTVAPDYAEVRDYHVRVNREINRPDNDYVDRNLQTEDGPF